MKYKAVGTDKRFRAVEPMSMRGQKSSKMVAVGGGDGTFLRHMFRQGKFLISMQFFAAPTTPRSSTWAARPHLRC